VGKAVIDYSDIDVGKASLLKVIGNTFIISMIQALAEGHVLAEKSGLGTENLEKFLETVFSHPYMIHSKRISSGAYHSTEVSLGLQYQPRSPLQPMVNIGMAQTVADHVLELAKSTGTNLACYEVAKRRMDLIEEHAGKKGDIDGLYGAVRLESGMKYEN
jgi:3-hydroxyisobutyrate dehydrogenase-like beta-hydroxyacid dehydrogenase